MSANIEAAIDRHVDAHLMDYIADLQALRRLPGVAAPARTIDETADATRLLLGQYGVEARVLPTERFPVGYGEALANSPKRVLCYNHYDVQPAVPFVQLVAETAWDVYDRPAVIHPTSGGSGPMHAFVQHLGTPIANVGIGYPDSGAHAPNEHIRLEDFARGIKRTARVFLRLAAT